MISIRYSFRRGLLRKEIKRKGGRVSGKVRFSLAEDSEFVVGDAVYLNGGGITAAQRMQIVVMGRQIMHR